MRTTQTSFLAILCGCIAFSGLSAGVFAQAGKAPSEQQKYALRQTAARAGMSFVPNRGQAPAGDLFLARGRGTVIGLQREGFEIDWMEPAARKAESPKAPASDGGMPARLNPPAAPETGPAPAVRTVHLQFAGSSAAVQVEGLDASPTRVNYIEGGDPSRWKTNLPSFQRVRYKDLYPGIDLVYYGQREGRLEYDLVVAPGADPGQVRIRVASARGASLDRNGNLLLDGEDGRASLMRPMLYQDVEAGKHAIAGSFVKLANGDFGFVQARYDHTRPLIVDPQLSIVYATFAGGIHDDQSLDMTLDASGNAYLTGWAASEDFPVSANAIQQVRKNLGSYLYDAVIMKFDSSGTLLFSTYLGGSQNDQGEAIRVSSTGLVYVGGYTASNDFPVTSNALQSTFGGSSDAFFAVLSNDGSQLVYSTYLGGTGDEGINRIVEDATGNLWVAGGASGPGLPVTSGAYQTKPNSTDNGFVAEFTFNPALAQPLTVDALTFLGGSSTNDEEFGLRDLALDAAGNVYVTGGSNSTDYPVTANAYETSSSFTLDNGCYNAQYPNSLAVVSELSANLKTLLYSTALGGKTEDQNGYPDCNQFGLTVHPDNKGNIWVVGTTGMQDFPTTSNALSKQMNGNNSAGADLFVAELTPGTNATTLTYGTYLGGSAFDYGGRAFWDANNDIWIVATTQSIDWPGIVTGTSLQTTNGGGYDIGLLELQPDGTKILYSTYLGGSGDEDASLGRATLAIDNNANLHIAGGTGSSNFPVTAGAFQTKFADGDSGPDGYDVYYAILGTGAIGNVTPASGGNTGDGTFTVSGVGIQPGATCSLTLGGVTLTSTTAAVNAAGTSIACTFALNGATPGTYTVAVTNPGQASLTAANTYTLQSGGGANIWVNVIGRSTLRQSTPDTFYVPYGNSGTVNAYGVTLLLVFPSTVTVSENFTVTSASTLSGPPPLNYTGENTPVVSGNVQYLTFYLPVVAAGASGALSFGVTDPNLGNETMMVEYLPPLTSSLKGFAAIASAFKPSPELEMPLLPRASAVPPGIQASACLTSIVSAVGAAVAAANPVSTGAACIGSGTDLLFSLASTALTNETNSNLVSGVISGGGIWAGVAGTVYYCTKLVLPPGAQVAIAAAQVLFGSASVINNCGGYAQQAWNWATKNGKDPNDKGGSAGDSSASAYVNGLDDLPYTVAFENEPAAGLPVAKAVITDRLDPTKVDLTTLNFGPISFAGNTVNPPQKATSFTADIAPKGVTAYTVRTQASLDQNTGLLTWTFETIDPTTNLPPTDPTVGFLPPDSNGIVGSGSVVYSVLPKAGQATGTSITNVASVVFDANAPIATPTWVNTLDVSAPVSKVTALPATVAAGGGASAPFTVNWSGTDVGSGIATYTVYVSDNGSAYTAWQTLARTTSATYTGTVGHTYGFYSLATDKVGNVEAAKSAAETSTTVVGTATATTTSLTAAPLAASPGTAVTFTATVSPAAATGTVTFLNGTATLGQGTLSGGIASFTTSSLAAGSYAVTAVYGGNTVYSGSTSAVVIETIVAPGFTLSANPSSLAIAAGTSGSATITLTPTGGFNQTVSLACSGLPVHTSCSFTPSSLIPSGSAVTSTLLLTTNVASARLSEPFQETERGKPLLAVVLLGFTTLLAATRRRRMVPEMRRSLLSLVILLAALTPGLLAGCGSGTIVSNATPKGTSTVTVTATGGSQTATATLSVTIQ